MLVFTISVEEVVEESCYDEDGLYFDEDDGVWYCVDEDGVEYWFDEGCDFCNSSAGKTAKHRGLRMGFLSR